jgi:hypothetical protein
MGINGISIELNNNETSGKNSLVAFSRRLFFTLQFIETNLILFIARKLILIFKEYNKIRQI